MTTEKIFPDEPIQWHLETSKHDRCPECGGTDLGYSSQTFRWCKKGCGPMLGFNVRVDPSVWLQAKLGELGPPDERCMCPTRFPTKPLDLHRYQCPVRAEHYGYVPWMHWGTSPCQKMDPPSTKAA